MHDLADIIITGWPDDIKEVPHPLRPYCQHHETLPVKDGLVLCREALIIPPSERERIQLHQFHPGITKSQLLVHGCIFWPGINKAIEEVVHQCEACIQFQAQNAAIPPHSYANSILPMADVHLGHLYPGRSQLPHMW